MTSATLPDVQTLVGTILNSFFNILSLETSDPIQNRRKAHTKETLVNHRSSSVFAAPTTTLSVIMYWFCLPSFKNEHPAPERVSEQLRSATFAFSLFPDYVY